ncbi:hypothetical protein [Saccharibacillus qingshengii]|uniref:prenylated flavin chaperone LpdD n=1 Tax=Saccharibacillus qingshengii TaxID=1763540 RepID=UPI0015566ED4|nr:hypothetical protein [Saccharibacillus qingshengii]
MAYLYDPADIRVERREMGRDLLLIVTGGDAHIGAVSMAYAEEGRVRVETSTVPGHKESVLSEPAALQAARLLACTVTVAMGIHYDGLNREQIEEIGSIVSIRIEEALNEAAKLI